MARIALLLALVAALANPNPLHMAVMMKKKGGKADPCLLFDDFDRPDETPIGPPWNSTSGTAGTPYNISSNTLIGSDSQGTGRTYHTFENCTSDMWILVEYTALRAGTDDLVGVLLRDGGSTVNYLAIRWRSGLIRWDINVCTSNSPCSGTITTITNEPVPIDGGWMGFSVTANTYKVYSFNTKPPVPLDDCGSDDPDVCWTGVAVQQKSASNAGMNIPGLHAGFGVTSGSSSTMVRDNFYTGSH